MNIEKIVDSISKVPQIAQQNNFNDREWTEEIKNIIAKSITNNNLKVFTTVKTREYPTEWLYDLSIVEFDNSENIIKIHLVMESEWSLSKEEIIYDFNKLLQAKSDFKMMIFEQKTEEKINDILQLLTQKIDIYNLYNNSLNEKYILFGYCINEKRFIHLIV